MSEPSASLPTSLSLRSVVLRLLALALLVGFAWPLPAIVAHTSHEPAVLGRYALDWFAFSLIHLLIVMALAVGNIWLWLALRRGADRRWIERLRPLHDRPLPLVLTVATISVMGTVVWSALLSHTTAAQLSGLELAVKLGPPALAGMLLVLRDRLLFFPASRSHLLGVLFVAVNALVAYNAIAHPRGTGYDVEAHLQYVEAVSFLPPRLPTPADTPEFFSAPLPYLLPALFNRACAASQRLWGFPAEPCVRIAAKVGQLQNIPLSLGLTILLVYLCELAHPGHSSFKVVTLLLLGMLPVYYRTLSLLRGEPFVAFFALLTVYWLLRMVRDGDYGLRASVRLGAALGLLALSRQWGLMLYPAIALWALVVLIRQRHAALPLGRALTAAFALAAVVGGWFYLSLYLRFGTLTAFNMPPARTFSLANQPPDFYLGLGDGLLFRDPTRPSFENQALPILYADTWGDYWEYHLIRGDNQRTLIPFLGRVAALSLYPTLILMAGVLAGAADLLRWPAWVGQGAPQAPGWRSLAALVVLVSLAGYAWFLIRYPHPRGATIKATYILQVFPFAALLGADLLEWARSKRRWVWGVLLLLLVLVIGHNLPALVTHHAFE